MKAPEEIHTALRALANGYCDWTIHGTRSDDGRYKTECSKCMVEVRAASLKLIADAIAAARKDEREACEGIAAKWRADALRHDMSGGFVAEQIAVDIRARSIAESTPAPEKASER